MTTELIKNIYYFIVVTLFGLMSSTKTLAQNVTSPYSLLGIGDIETKDFGRYFGSGNASLARRDLNFYNFSNPASLTALPFKTMNFDISLRGRNSQYYFPDTDTALGIPSNDIVVKRVTMAFKVSEKTAVAFGLKPYSSSNYRYLQENVILDGNSILRKLVDGSGGINQFYFSYAKEINKRISVGFTGSLLFGTLKRVTQYISPALSLNMNKVEQDFYNGGVFQASIQYYSLPGKKWQHQLGIVNTISTNLRGELTTEYLDQSGSIRKDVDTDRNFKMPISIGIGYSAIKSNRIIISLDANYHHWQYQKVNYSKSYINPSFRISTGFEYLIIKKQGSAEFEKGYISAGMNLENSYLRINNNNLWDYSLSAGVGRNISRLLSLYSGVEFGNKGRRAYMQVQERYLQYVLGVTLKQIWIGPKFTRRYD